MSSAPARQSGRSDRRQAFFLYRRSCSELLSRAFPLLTVSSISRRLSAAGRLSSIFNESLRFLRIRSGEILICSFCFLLGKRNKGQKEEQQACKAEYGTGRLKLSRRRHQRKRTRPDFGIGRGPSMSIHLLADRRLFGPKERLNQFSLATHRHAGQTLEPFPRRDFWILIEPFREQAELSGRNFPFPNAFQQMVEEGGGGHSGGEPPASSGGHVKTGGNPIH